MLGEGAHGSLLKSLLCYFWGRLWAPCTQWKGFHLCCLTLIIVAIYCMCLFIMLKLPFLFLSLCFNSIIFEQKCLPF